MTHFFSVCETIYHQKNVSESKPECKTVTEPMCMMSSSGIETCLDMPKKVSPATRKITDMSREQTAVEREN